MRTLRTAACALFLLWAAALHADDRRVDFDIYSDFSAFKTFAVGAGKVNSPKPELNNPLILQKIGDAVRARLAAKGLKETSTRPDIVASYYISSMDYSAQRGGSASHTEGTIVVDLVDPNSGILLWRGVYRDQEKNAIKLAQKIFQDTLRSAVLLILSFASVSFAQTPQARIEDLFGKGRSFTVYVMMRVGVLLRVLCPTSSNGRPSSSPPLAPVLIPHSKCWC
jgi:hypothetical protein